MDSFKTCRKCGVEKLLSEFYTREYGTRNDCKKCTGKTSAYNKIGKIPLHEREIKSRLRNINTKARLRTKEFNLVDDDLLYLWGKQDGRCAYTKLPLLAAANQFNTVSLDRIDSSKGYVVGNVQLVCAAINVMKMDSTEKQFIHLCQLVAQNSKLSELPE